MARQNRRCHARIYQKESHEVLQLADELTRQLEREVDYRLAGLAWHHGLADLLDSQSRSRSEGIQQQERRKEKWSQGAQEGVELISQEVLRNGARKPRQPAAQQTRRSHHD
jgi:hypothetical protein